MNGVNGATNGSSSGAHEYSVPEEAFKVFQSSVLSNPLVAKDLPKEITEASSHVHFWGSESPSVPVNWRFAEAVAALKGLEAALVNVLLKRKYNVEPQDVNINTDHAVLFVMATLLWTLDPAEGGLNLTPTTLRGANKELEKYFPNCDKHGMNSSQYRNLATNIYKCKDGRFYHTHNSLNPDPTLDCMELPHNMDIPSYEEGVKPFMEAFAKIGSKELDAKYNDVYRQAGTICYSVDEFAATEHGKANADVGLWEIYSHPNPKQTAPWWPDSPQTSPTRPLAGLKVIDLTRIIAAPTVTRGLADFGASVMRCTSPNLPDVNGLHVDLNWGKWNCSIDLRNPDDREKLRALIMEADVVVQSYRPNILDKYGFSQEDILKLVENRERGMIYARVNCYGWHGPWVERSGWQQISDACTGISHGFGQALGHGDPVTPIFPHTDYGCGIAGSCAIIIALLRQAESGGSYSIDLSLNYYNTWLAKFVGTYPDDVFAKVRAEHGNPMYQHWHNNGFSVPVTMKALRAGEGGKRLFQPDFFEDRSAPTVMGDKKIRKVKGIAQFQDVVQLGFNVGTRGNGIDAARWPTDLMVDQVV
ncbi:putative L-carnitine dehydratase [Rhizodiscina lignyota]|uniref:L-carnitine dehydratase n=1 Tax=Rhizodiscina lignyota TaxID=1504668 RepID=A0A9P4IKR0_9PEZI|nr:putative L-carnitine dehydratase [Rhizodiscina lignyota]